MIHIGGSARRSYAFPAPLDVAFRFHTDIDAMLALLPYIELVGTPSKDTRRLCYRATESGLYDVRIYCTVIADLDARRHRIVIRPLEDDAEERCGFRSMSGRGRYASTIAFVADGASTRVDYALTLSATLPTPTSLRLLPAAIVDARAAHRFGARLDEILDGFVRGSLDAFARRARGAQRVADGSAG